MASAVVTSPSNEVLESRADGWRRRRARAAPHAAAARQSRGGHDPQSLIRKIVREVEAPRDVDVPHADPPELRVHDVVVVPPPGPSSIMSFSMMSDLLLAVAPWVGVHGGHTARIALILRAPRAEVLRSRVLREVGMRDVIAREALRAGRREGTEPRVIEGGEGARPGRGSRSRGRRCSERADRRDTHRPDAPRGPVPGRFAS